jgi:cyclophilin family peptidyl-prolyl cis-trans isomerase
MRKLASSFWKMVREQRRRAKVRPTWRPTFEPLEDRLTPTANGFNNIALGVITGTVYINPTNSNVFQSSDIVVPGATVSLTGTTTSGTPVNVNAVTDSKGAFTFFQIQPGTYSLSESTPNSLIGGKASIGNLGGSAGTDTVSLISVSQGQAGVNYNLSVLGLAAGGVSLRQFLATTSGFDTNVLGQAGTGVASVDNTVQPSAPATPGTASLTGTLSGPGNNAGVEVILSGIDNTGRDIVTTTATDAAGGYTIQGLQPGNYTLTMTAPQGVSFGAPAIGSVGGTALRNDQIVGISLAAGANGTGYNFTEQPLSVAVISAGLANDTAGPGGSTSDGITSDSAVLGSITSTSPITSFTAGFDSTAAAQFTSILSDLGANNTFRLNAAQMAQIAGGTLADGAHTLHLQMTNKQGQTDSVDVSFALDTAAVATPTLHMDSTSDPTQSGRTTASTVTLSGTTSAGVGVTLTQGSATQSTTADASGNFSFSGISLVGGLNTFTVQATDKAGNTSQLNTSFVRQSAPQAASTQIAESVGQKDTTDTMINLSSPTIFTDPNASNTLVKFNTAAGPMVVELFDTATPQTVANFLSYVESGFYNNDIFHRLDTSPPVLQGGGWTLGPNGNTIATNTAGPDVANEFSPNNPNAPGTIAMAKQGGNQNSGSDQFFFNLGDNSVTLGAANNGGFTVFGKVLSGADQRVLNTLGAFPVMDESKFNNAFNVFPIRNYTGTNFPTDTTAANYALINTMTILQQSDQLSYSVVSNSDNSIVTASINQGQLVLHPTGTGTGTAAIVVQAANKGGQTTKTTFNVTVGNVGLINPGNQSDQEGDQVTLSLTSSDSGGGSPTFSANGLPTGLSIDSSSGQISGTISSGAFSSSPYQVSVTATDGADSATQTFTWNVYPIVTVAPVASQTNQEGDKVNLQLTGTDTNSKPLTWTATGLPPGLTLGSTTGTITGTIATGAAANSPFTVNVTASTGTESNTTTFQWTVTSVVSVTPVPTQNNLEGDSVSLQVAAKDSAGLPLTYSATGLPGGLSINPSTGLITGTVSSGAASGSPYNVTVKAADGTHSGSQTFTWNVAIVAVSVPNQTNIEGDSVNVQVTAKDAHGLPLTYTASNLPNGLVLNSKTGAITGSLAAGSFASSPYTVTVSATDGTNTGTATFTWVVHPVVTISPVQTQTNTEGQSAALQISAGDANLKPLSYAASGLPSGLTINSSTGLITGTITPGDATNSPYKVTITVSDSTFSNTVSFTWIVNPVVTINTEAAQVNTEGDTPTVPITASDSLGKTLTYSAVNLPPGLNINANTGVIVGTVAPGAHSSTPYNVTVTASDGTFSGKTTFNWTINPVVSISALKPLVNLEGDNATVQVVAFDAKGKTLTYSATGLPPGLSINAGTGLISGTITGGAFKTSPFSVTVTVTDGTFSNTGSFTWTVNPVVTVTTIPTQTDPEGSAVSVQVTAHDAKNETLTYSISGQPAGVTINSSTGLISGVISTGAAASSPYTVIVTASDGTFSSTQTFTWTVT